MERERERRGRERERQIQNIVHSCSKFQSLFCSSGGQKLDTTKKMGMDWVICG
jgi:hypothetical protein